ncbi:AraC family transcriptional regulator [Homoserinibacter sp. GY 40078]|uniref:helix-turn-helix domain-containing protein n=1 Tax=Homoserinibacter sp. GY 40078 TaxID=2603275 RepID=UPI0011C92280|nr:AraC family transcriptional regulator [Homoserinibacter sp. GY 40078]TXK18843.1 helix-turn-helix transcriptional regulator [Homoserinibacter sp. GY 40078]
MQISRQPDSDEEPWPLTGVGWWDGKPQAMHEHADGQLIYPIAGVLAITTEIGTWMAAANRVGWTPAGWPHAHRAPARTQIAALAVPRELAESLPSQPAVFAASPLLREVLLALTGDRPLRVEARERLERVVIDELVDAAPEAAHLPEPRDDRLSAVTSLLRADLTDARTLTELGHEVGASARTLSRLFHDELGMGFHQWRTQLRIQNALVLLWDGHTVAETAVLCGWSSPSSFVEAFRASVGQTPGRYQAGRHQITDG